MLNISRKSIADRINTSKYRTFQTLSENDVSNRLIKIFIALLVIFLLSMWLPWTQNIRSKGFVSTLSPDDKPQAIQSVIDGQIVRWFVQEGQIVNQGDTILQLKESKSEYLDPEIIDRTKDQVDAKGSSIDAYDKKLSQLDKQSKALINTKKYKLEENQLKINQTRFQLKADSALLVSQKISIENEEKQFVRMQEMHSKGIKSLSDLEKKRFALENSRAKLSEVQNKLKYQKAELDRLIVSNETIANQYDEKIAKILSEQMSVESEQFKILGDQNKLKSKLNQLKVRKDNNFLLAPITGRLTKSIKYGIGEFVKAGEDIITIVPSEYQLAVEMFVSPRDVPLLEIEQKVRVQFDGWPAIVFSGWPQNSYGTFPGEVFAIDNDISENGKYRVLIKESSDEKKWPPQLRIGGGAEALVLLKDVKIYYEMWRKLNGFPPDYYKNNSTNDIKTKAPARKIK